MAEKLLADPKVVKAAVPQLLEEPTTSSRLIEQEVSRRNTVRRRESMKRAQERAKGEAVPLPAHTARMVVKMNEWSSGLAGLVDDLDDLPDGPSLELVRDAAEGLARQAQRWVDKLDRRPDLHVIEGEGTDVT